MSYTENPKTAGSGIVCAIPQRGRCPGECAECFFNGGRSYLEPLDERTPNMPSLAEARGRVVRVNDGNDSNVDRNIVLFATDSYEDKFFNTSHPQLDFPAPVVLTVNPDKKTDNSYWHLEKPPPNLMFVRARANSWNVSLVDDVVRWYTGRGVPVVLTPMAYRERPSGGGRGLSYEWRKHILNKYWALTPSALRRIVERYAGNELVYACEGRCVRCGNCLREYYAAKERMRCASS